MKDKRGKRGTQKNNTYLLPLRLDDLQRVRNRSIVHAHGSQRMFVLCSLVVHFTIAHFTHIKIRTNFAVITMTSGNLLSTYITTVEIGRKRWVVHEIEEVHGAALGPPETIKLVTIALAET